MRISDWSSDVCSSDLVGYGFAALFLRLHDDAIFLTPISVGGNAPGAEKCLQGFADVLHRDAEIAGAVGVYRNVQLGLGFLVIAIEIDDSGIIRGGGHDRQSVVQGQSVSVRVDLVGRCLMTQKKTIQYNERYRIL